MMDLVRDSVELLRGMVRIPSMSFEEGTVCAYVASALKGWGIECRAIGNNIVSCNRFYDPSLPSLALDAHIDTVPAAQSYTRDPFDPGCDSDVIWGLGSNDDGGSVVAMIAAFRHFYEKRMPFNLMLLLTCEEERSGPDGARLLYGKESPLSDADIRWVIVGEPTGMRAAISERGLLVLDGEARGVSGHAARNEGANAVYLAMEDIARLRAHKFPKISPLMGEVSLNVTQIAAGTAHNVIPDKCSFVVDIRPTEQYTNEEILSELQGLCVSTLKARNLTNCSSASYPGSPLVRTAEKLGIRTFSSPTTSDWMRTRRDAIKMGPGDSSRSHKADEYILSSEIEEAVGIYINFITEFYGDTLE